MITVREAARRAQCQNNLKQISLATLNYAYTHNDTLPDAARNDRVGLSGLLRINNGVHYPFSWRATILPYLEEQSLHDQLDFGSELGEDGNSEALKARVLPVFQCPSALGSPRVTESLIHWPDEFKIGATDYFAVVNSPHREAEDGYDARIEGAWRYYRATLDEQRNEDYHPSRARLSKITDGLSKTILLQDKVWEGEGWASQWPPRYINEWLGRPDDLGAVHRKSLGGLIEHSRNGYLFAHHVTGTNFATCDGAVRFVSAETDSSVISAMGTRAGREVSHQMQ